jgi:hypothetical protein
LLALAACEAENGSYGSSNEYLRQYAHAGATPTSFYVCYGYGCKYSSRVSLSADEWQSVRALADSPSEDKSTALRRLAQDERQSVRTSGAGRPSEEVLERRRISLTVALLDDLVGARIGTLVHQRREYNSGDPSQYDCIDESINTWTYLTLLDHQGLLRYHQVGDLAHAGTVLGFDVRNTATLVSKGDGTPYAIDPTLVDVGQPPPIVPLQRWVASYPPEISKSDQ